MIRRSVRVISGTFTDAKVEGAAGAAQVVNDMSGLIGAPAGFADPDNITVQQVDTAGGYSRTIYRVHHSVEGIEVVGSDVVLVTDPDGKVTGLFNYYDARADAMNTTPDRRVDTETGAVATALAAYAGTPNSPLYLLAAAPLVAGGTVRPQLMIDATDDAAGPQLVWKVSIDPPDTDLTGARTVNPGSTYYISAGGAEAGTVTRTTSNAQPLAIGSPTSTTADDVLGNSRDIGITRLSLVIFDLDSLNDVGRDISTYETTYLLVFLGPPQTPGFPVFRGFSGWDASAVSAHANMATVYDYYATQLGVTSFDDDGAPIVVSTDYNPHESLDDYTGGYENAFWDSAGQQFAFGDTGDFEAALDVVGHEYTHAVMEHQGGTLDYGESGALNEAYADIMGVLIEGKDRDDPGRWLIGEDTSAGAIRSLADPGSTPGYRTDYADLYTGTDDEGGEHYNSTIFSHAAYRMMTDERTAGVTDQQWAQLYYVSMTMLDDGAKFSDGRDAVVATAHDQGFTDDEIAAIENGFDSVHIDGGGTVVSV
ncbi:M4 family metallopeptidase [Mycolicibacterium sp. 050232]|uniref:M4 family metallopeptidase n=1 Tax=Mycolicibacterium sp. 050232 TaxID=3113982 RepID=UPI002E28E699|nr:M4 family metallopeptidase [Mycolicibacterium sp. 050232]MED5815295.1 M4 family metallopeptidase [Mycolicibacterium sp. 050232]